MSRLVNKSARPFPLILLTSVITLATWCQGACPTCHQLTTSTMLEVKRWCCMASLMHGALTSCDLYAAVSATLEAD